MAYLYRHIRLDKNVPFYIGIGSDKNYYRAYDKKHRNKFWKNIYDKTEIEVEILLDEMTWDEACNKEKEFINIYGKYPQGTLCNMTNGGDGILGLKRGKKFSERNSQIHKGKILSDIVRKKISDSHKNKKLSEEHKKNISKAIKGRKLSEIHKQKIGTKNKSINHGNWCGYIYQYDLQNKLIEVFDTLQSAYQKTKVGYREISKVCSYYNHIENGVEYSYSKNYKTAGGYIWKRKMIKK